MEKMHHSERGACSLKLTKVSTRVKVTFKTLPGAERGQLFYMVPIYEILPAQPIHILCVFAGGA